MTTRTQDGRYYATVVLYAPDGWQPERPADAHDVVVSGRDGFYGTVSVKPGYGPTAPRPGALAWSYQPNAWAVVYSFTQDMQATPLTEEQARQVAESVRPGPTHPARVPVRFSDLPGDFQVRGVIQRPAYQSERSGDTDAIVYLGSTDTPSIALTVAVNAAAPGCRDGIGQDITIGPYSGTYLPGSASLGVCDDHVHIAVASLVETGGQLLTPHDGQPAMSLDQLRAVVRGITLAPDILDPATWFDAATTIA